MNEKRRTNSNAVIALTVGILSILIPVIGLVLGVIGTIISKKAMKDIENKNEGGKELATYGFACSVAGIIVQLLGLLLIIALSFFTIS